MTAKKPVDDLVEAIATQADGPPDETPSIGEVVGTISDAVAAVAEERTPELWGKFRVSLESHDLPAIEDTAKRLGLAGAQVRVAAACLDSQAEQLEIIAAGEGAVAELQEIDGGLVIANRIKPTSVDQAEQVAKDLLALEKRRRQVNARRVAAETAYQQGFGPARIAPELFGIGPEDKHRLSSAHPSVKLCKIVQKELDQDPYADWLAYGRKPAPRRRARLVTRRSK